MGIGPLQRSTLPCQAGPRRASATAAWVKSWPVVFRDYHWLWEIKIVRYPTIPAMVAALDGMGRFVVPIIAGKCMLLSLLLIAGLA